MTMGDDLLLLAVVPRWGRIRIRGEGRVGFALRAAELVDLSLAGRIVVGTRRIEVLDSRRVGTPRLSNVLNALATAAPPHSVESWLRRTPRSLTTEYLSRLEDQRTVRVRRRRDSSGRTRHRILSVDLPLRRALVARLDTAVRAGSATSTAGSDVALAVLAQAAGISAAVYPGLRGVAGRRRMAALATDDRLAALVGSAAQTVDEELAASITTGVDALSVRLHGQLRRIYSDMTTGGHGLGHDLSPGTWSDGTGHHGGHHGGGHHGGHHGGGHDSGGSGGW